MRNSIEDIKIIFDRQNYWHVIQIEKDTFDEYWGEMPSCNHCGSPISKIKQDTEGFFICTTDKKTYCVECETRKGEIKREDTICKHSLFEDEHIHNLIRNIDIIE